MLNQQSNRYHAFIAEAMNTLQEEYKNNTTIIQLLKRDRSETTDSFVLTAVGLENDMLLDEWLGKPHV